MSYLGVARRSIAPARITGPGDYTGPVRGSTTIDKHGRSVTSPGGFIQCDWNGCRFISLPRLSGLGAGGDNQRKFADVLENISHSIRGERTDVIGNPCTVQNALLYIGGGFALYKLIELVVKR